MFTSSQGTRRLHTVDGTNDVALRVDDINVQYFAVPSSYSEETIFFISTDGNRSRRNYDYEVELEGNALQTFGPIHEITGTKTFVQAVQGGQYMIVDFEFNELLTYDMSSTGTEFTDNCYMEGTAWLGICFKEIPNQGAIYRMPHLCSDFCPDSCFSAPKEAPSMNHGCEMCKTGYILQGEETCIYYCHSPTEIPNETNDGCVACPSCCEGSGECGYDFSQSNFPLKCYGTISERFYWDNGKCTFIPSMTTESEFDFEVILNKKNLQAFVVFDVAPVSFELESNVFLTFKIVQSGSIIQKEEISRHTSQSLSKINDTTFRIDIHFNLTDYKAYIDMEFKDLFFLDSDSAPIRYQPKIYQFKV